jgi:hypothetical protein
MNVADRFAGDAGSQTNPLSKHFDESVKSLMQVTERYVDSSPNTMTLDIVLLTPE